jgi:putative transcriptional regulator
MNEANTTTKTGKHDWSRFDAKTDTEVHVAAVKDPDARPLTEEDFARMKLVPRAKTLRRALGLSQEEFAVRFSIPLSTLRDWEQGRTEPDQAARAYLKVIAYDAQAVQRALEYVPGQPR